MSFTNIENFIRENTCKIAINKFPTTNEPWKYRHPDFYYIATRAFKEGRKEFYIEPVNPRNPKGAQKECEPKYKYVLHAEMSEEEYKELLKQFKGD